MSHIARDNPENKTFRLYEKKRPTLTGRSFFSWNPATSYSPRCSPMCWIRHRRRTWGNLTKYNVARSSETTGEMDVTDAQRKSPRHRLRLFLCGIRQRPTLPGRLQPSTIGAERLNFCVRYGNRWIPFAIVTGKL